MLSKIIAQLRNSKKKTQKEVARELGLTYQRYNHYETGKRQPDNETLVLLADYFSVSLDELLGRNVIITKDKLPPALQDTELDVILKTAKNNGMTNADIKRALEADQILKSVYGKDDSSDRGKDNT